VSSSGSGAPLSRRSPLSLNASFYPDDDVGEITKLVPPRNARFIMAAFKACGDVSRMREQRRTIAYPRDATAPTY
jgi:hypothetical protein